MSPKRKLQNALIGLTAMATMPGIAQADFQSDTFENKNWSAGLAILSNPAIKDSYGSPVAHRAHSSSQAGTPGTLTYDVPGGRCDNYVVSVGVPVNNPAAENKTSPAEVMSLSFDSGPTHKIRGTYTVTKGETMFRLVLRAPDVDGLDTKLATKNTMFLSVPFPDNPNKTLDFRFSLAGSKAAIQKVDALCAAAAKEN